MSSKYSSILFLSLEKKNDDEDEAASNSQQWFFFWDAHNFNDWFSGYKSEASSRILLPGTIKTNVWTILAENILLRGRSIHRHCGHNGHKSVNH